MTGPVVVIGGGHNGLVCAALLARAGRPVTLVERRGVLGGLAARDDFAPGCRVPGLLHDTAAFRATLADELELERHGLRWVDRDPDLVIPLKSGEVLRLPSEDAAVPSALAPHAKADAEAWPRWRRQVAALQPFVARLLDEPPPDLEGAGLGALWELARTGLALRRLGRRDMAEVLRVLPMCAADWLNEWFELPELKGALAAPAVEGTWLGPWSAGSAAELLFRECTRGRSVSGGPAALVDALAASARASGVEVRGDAPVERVVIDGGRVTGVRLASGEVLPAEVVAASCDPVRTLLHLVAPADLPPDLAHRMSCWRQRGTTAKVHLALDAPFGVLGEPAERVRVVGDLDDLERAFDAVKYDEVSRSPILDVWAPPPAVSGLAPEGRHVVSVLVHYAPYDLAGGWTDARRQALLDGVLTVLERWTPGLPGHVVASELLTPPDLEGRYGLTGGHVHHGEHALDQFLHLRPAAGCARYETPIGGLYLCGSGSHPGGGLTGAPGRLAARAILAR